MWLVKPYIGVWRSLVARFVRDEEAVGSNPATPTKTKCPLVYAIVHQRTFCLFPVLAKNSILEFTYNIIENVLIPCLQNTK